MTQEFRFKKLRDLLKQNKRTKNNCLKNYLCFSRLFEVDQKS